MPVTRDGKSPMTAWRRRCERAGPTAAAAAPGVRRLAAPRRRAPLSPSAPVPRADARRETHPTAAPAVGAEPLLLPDAHSHQRRAHPVEVERSRFPPHVDPSHPRPRRRRSRRRRPGVVVALGRGRGARRGGGGELPLGAAGRPLRVRWIRRAGARAQSGGSGRLVADRVLRPRSHVAARRGLGAPLPVGALRRARVFPLARAARPPRLPGGHGLRRPPRHDVCAAGALRGRVDPQNRDPLASARLPLRRRGAADRNPSGGRRMTPSSRPRLVAKARLRFDRLSQRYLLLYPERGLALSPTAAEILKLCTGEHSIAAIVERLMATYGGQAPGVVEREVLDFLASMQDRGVVTDG